MPMVIIIRILIRFIQSVIGNCGLHESQLPEGLVYSNSIFIRISHSSWFSRNEQKCGH